MADLTEKLTFEQSVMLTYLKERQGVAGFIHGPKMAMLRRLEARELVTCSKHGLWRITEAGKAALSARGER
jgi:uncharacterized protein YjhX (UPF0386 family)